MPQSTALEKIRKKAKQLQRSKGMPYQAALKAAGRQYKATKKKAVRRSAPKKVVSKSTVTKSKTVTVGKARKKVKPASYDLKIAKDKLIVEIGDLYGKQILASKKPMKKKIGKQIREKRAMLNRITKK